LLTDPVASVLLDDLRRADGSMLDFPPHVRSFAGKLSLRQTAELMAGAGVVIGNDSGLAHIAAAVGTPTVMIFGPTPDASLAPFPPNARILRSVLPCEPCWFQDRFRACAGRIDCLKGVDIQTVIREICSLLPAGK
jgi:ADP-heptose:LPS heptosyltransferase